MGALDEGDEKIEFDEIKVAFAGRVETIAEVVVTIIGRKTYALVALDDGNAS